MTAQSDRITDLSQIRQELQQIIIEAFGDGLPVIPDDIPILDLGIGSLALVDGMRQVYDRLGVLVSMRRVIEGQMTLGSLALYIEQELNSQRAPRKRSQAAPQAFRVQREVPLVPSQQHIGFLFRYSSEAAAAFNESLVLRLLGPLHGPALTAAIEEVGERYEALRTTLSPDKDVLTIGAGEPLELPVSPVAGAQLDKLLAEIVTRPFEAGQRLFRAELLRQSEVEHILVLVGHALVIDSEALALVLEDVSRLYTLFSRDEQATPPPLVIQWTDYLALGDTAEANEAKRRGEIYWKGVYSAGLPKLELPSDQPRPPVKKYNGARLSLPLEASLDERLRAWAAAEGKSKDLPLLAAFTTFLHRLSGQDELVMGVESEPLYLASETHAITRTRHLLPLRSGFDPATSFRNHLEAQRELLAAANAHRHVSRAELIGLLAPARDQSRSALFTVAFRGTAHLAAPYFEGLDDNYLIPPSSGARYDLELQAVSSETGTQLVCDYSTELFGEQTITHWLHGLLSLLDAALEDSEQPCGLLPMMTASDRDMLLNGWNETAVSYPRELAVLDLVFEQALARPEQIAIRFKDETLLYRQMLERTEAIAVVLQAKGISKGDRVGLLLKRSLDLIPAILAVWRAGGIYVPMDIGFPGKRLAYMLEDAGVKVVLTQRELLARLDQRKVPAIVCLEDVGNYSPSPLAAMPPLGAAECAYIMYTSGSTGQPKGVEVRQRALVNCLLAARNALEFKPESSMLALTTISFDISTNELFMPLMSGGCVEIGEDGLLVDGIQLAERITRHRPSHVQATPSTWKTILAAGWAGDEDICLLSAGEALSRELAEELLPRCHALWNLYGPTETTVYSSIYQVETAPGKPMPIGRPLANTEFYILDKHLQPVPLGAVGNLYIGGQGLAAGYWQKPELTNERFLANPFRPGERMYWTGDLSRYLPDGEVIYLGRLDDQVKIHGVRVELSEVEAALRAVQGVRDAVVVAWADPRGDTQLVGHVVLDRSRQLTTHQLREGLRERLPETMIPPYIMFCDSFPLTANGKVHRAALPTPDSRDSSSAEGAAEPPTGATERSLVKIWAGLLGITPDIIGRDSDFMDLGGHSLLMTRLMLDVQHAFQVSFSLREFFGASTLRKFAALIDERRAKPIDKNNGRHGSPVAHGADWSRQRMAFLKREAELPLYIAPGRGMTYQPTTEVNTILLTGATGFLGSYIVTEILKTTRAQLYCLVRPKRGEPGRQRIQNQLRHYGLSQQDERWQSAWEDRLHVLEGDVTLPRIGLPDSIYESLAREVDTIFHGAAHVNFIYPYEALRATNVLGLHEIIQFAFHARIKPVQHLSTAAIWPMGARAVYYETDSIEHGGRLNLGYDEAKWVGERCLLNAAERGLPMARFRPGEVGGDSLTGRADTEHFLLACFKGFLQFGAFPALDIDVDIAPVDYVARAMVYLALHREPTGQAYHLTNPDRRPMSQALAYLRSLGYQFDELPFEELRDRLVSSPRFSSNALFPYQAALEDMDGASMQVPGYDTRQALRELDGSGIACPPANVELFETYRRYLQAVGFLPEPEALVRA
jgi:myxalamid-type nonribosomal peptide synthetase MxaA